MILKVARLGHPVIRQTAAPVPEGWCGRDEARGLIDSMVETMREYSGVGLAAPQVHVPIRVAVIEIKSNARYPEAPEIPLTILINPKIVKSSVETSADWEGCLSVPDMRGRVDRALRCEIESLDEKGCARLISAEGFFARAIQHEIDHLDGKVYLDRMSDLSTLTFLEEFSRYPHSLPAGRQD